MKKSNVILNAVLAIQLLTTGVANATNLLPVGGTKKMVNGVNLAWLDGAYDHDIGYNYQHLSYGCAYNHAHMDQYIGDISNMGANVVRIWLYENMEGVVYDSNNHVTGVDPTFLTNLDDIVNNIAPAHNVYLYFTFLDGNDNFDTSPFFNIVTNSDGVAQSAYINNALKPLVARYKGNNRIFGFDIMNEPEAAVAGSTGNWGSTGTSWTIMQGFIKNCASAIHASDSTRLCTASSGWHAWNNIAAGLYANLGLDFYDFHQYDDKGVLPLESTLNAGSTPVLVGEYDQSSNRRSDSVQNASVQAFEANIFGNGYAGGLCWDYAYPGSTDTLGLLETKGGWRPACSVIKSYRVP